MPSSPVPNVGLYEDFLANSAQIAELENTKEMGFYCTRLKPSLLAQNTTTKDICLLYLLRKNANAPCSTTKKRNKSSKLMKCLSVLKILFESFLVLLMCQWDRALIEEP